MADNSKIEWCEATWNVITGCSIASHGCARCYAMKLAGGRMKHHWSRKGLTDDSKAGPVWNGKLRFNEAWLDQPLRWKRPRVIFVCAHSDLFHEDMPDEWIAQVWQVMCQAPQHTYQVLTKRPANMRRWLAEHQEGHPPEPHIWLGVSAEDQRRADERVPILLETPAAVRFLSAEPLVGRISLVNMVPLADRKRRYNALFGEVETLHDNDHDVSPCARLDWVIAGGESGQGARPMHPAWACLLRDQCRVHKVPFHFKQWGEWFPGVLDDMGEGKMYALPDVEHDHSACDWQGGPWTYRNVDGEGMLRVGKRRAGRRLADRTWDGMPA